MVTTICSVQPQYQSFKRRTTGPTGCPTTAGYGTSSATISKVYTGETSLKSFRLGSVCLLTLVDVVLSVRCQMCFLSPQSPSHTDVTLDRCCGVHKVKSRRCPFLFLAMHLPCFVVSPLALLAFLLIPSSTHFILPQKLILESSLTSSAYFADWPLHPLPKSTHQITDGRQANGILDFIPVHTTRASIKERTTYRARRLLFFDSQYK